MIIILQKKRSQQLYTTKDNVMVNSMKHLRNRLCRYIQNFRKQRKKEQSKLILLGQFYPDTQTRHHEKTTNPDLS